ncbi:mucin-5AC isoform X2 [Tetranychus urticae]|uniref:mucin-5AC isoform X2 n=1 Tax=Tetranychus urticae TaxID=32264 RepID=UPI00077B9D98|nr:mucin-5AC isoform X2 [Tetranychus urticae]
MKKRALTDKKDDDTKRRAEEHTYYVELAGTLAARMRDMPKKITKNEILNQTFNEINQIHKSTNHSGDLQTAEVSSSASTLCSSAVFSPWILEAIDGFLFVVDQDGIIQYITHNVHTFLRYKENELRGSPIGNIIHVGDLAKFNSKLLPMSALGNGLGWSGTSTSSLNTTNRGNGGSDISSSSRGFSSSPCSNDVSPSMLIGGLKSLGGVGGSTSSSGANKSDTFNARFLVNPNPTTAGDDNNDVNENDINSNDEFIIPSLTSNSSIRKSNNEFGENSGAINRDNIVSGCSLNKLSDGNAGVDEPVYQNLQLSVTLLPAPNYDRSSSSSNGNDFVLFCMARRIPQIEDSPMSNNVEQFSTKLDLEGKILTIDTSGVSATYSQYLNKTLIDKCILELGDPFDVINDHLRSTLKGNMELSPCYKFRVASDKYLLVQTQSRLWEADDKRNAFISSLHSIITNPDETANVSSQHQKQLQHVNTLTGTSSSTPDNSNFVGSPVSSYTRDCSNTVKSLVPSPFQSFGPVSPSSNSGSADYSLNDCLGLSKMFPSGLLDFDTNSENAEGSSSDDINETDKNSSDLKSSQNSQASVNVSSLMSHTSFVPSVSSSSSNYNPGKQNNSPVPRITPSSTTSGLRMGSTYSSATNEMLSQGTSDQNMNQSNSNSQSQQQHQSQQQQSQQQQQQQSQSQSQSHSGQSSQSQQSSGNSSSQSSHGSGQGALGIGLGSGSGSGSGQQSRQPPSPLSSRQPSPAPGSVPIQQLQIPSPEQPAVTPQAIQSPSGPASTQKLRNLLTQGIEADSPSNSEINQSNPGNHELLLELLNTEDEDVSGSSANNKSNTLTYGGNSSSNLLSGSMSVETTSTTDQSTTPFGASQSTSLSSNVSFKLTSSNLGQSSNDNVGNNNNMLRQLLNEDDSSKLYRRNQELINQWKEDGQSSSSNVSTGLPTSLSDVLMPPSSGSVFPSSRFTGGPGSVKRKSVDEHQLENETISGSQASTPGGNYSTGVSSKRPSLGGLSPGPQYNQTGKSPLTGLAGGGSLASSSQSIGNVSSASSSLSGIGIGTSIGSTTSTTISTSVTTTGATCGSTSGLASSGHGSGQPAQLAIQNPMLTSMLAQTPKTLPTPPISIPTSIVSQVPQERLPKNLEKKLIHTPANQMIGITSLASSVSSPTVVSSHVTSGGSQGIVSIANASISSSSHMTIKPRQSAPPSLSLQPTPQHQQQQQQLQQQQQQQQQQSQLLPQLHQPPQQSHLPQTSQQAFVISNSGQLQNFRPLHSQTQVQIVQTPARYPVFPDNRATAQPIQQLSNVQPGLHHQQLPNSGGQPNVSGQIKTNLTGLSQSQQPQLQQPLPQVSPQSPNVQSHVAFIESISSTTSSSISSSSILASSSLLPAVQDSQDPMQSEILDQVWSMQQELNIEPAQQSTITATAHSTTDDSMILDMLDAVLDPLSSNSSIHSTINLPVSSGISGSNLVSPPPDLNEMKAISEIRRQLMSCETSPSQPNHPGPLPATSRPPVFTHQTGSLPSPSLQQQQPNFSNSPAFQSPLCPPPAYGVTSVSAATPGSVHGVSSQSSQQQLILQQPGVSGGPGMRRFPGPPHPNGNLQSYPSQIIQHRATEHPQFNVTPGVVGPPLQLQPRGKGPMDSKKQRLFMAQQQQEKQRLLAQQTQQEYTLHTPPDRTESGEMPPNVSLQIKSRMGTMTPETGQLSPRYPILNVNAPTGGVQAQSSLPQSPAGGGNGPPSSSVASSLQSSFTSPSTGGPSTTYGQPAPQPSHRMSPHPYTSVPSPVGGRGPNSPAAHLQLASPQPSSTSSPVSAPHGWPPPVSTSNVPIATGAGPNSIRTLGPTGLPANRIQQQNPMLNAQLSQGTFSTTTAQPNIRCTSQPSPANQRLCNNRGSMASPSPSPLHSASRNSPIPQYPSSPGLYQSDRQTPVSSVGPLSSQATSSNIGQPRMINQSMHPQQQQRPQMMANRVNSPRFAARVSSGDDGSGCPGSSMGSPYSYPQPSTPIMDTSNPSGVSQNQFIFDNRSVSGAQTSTSKSEFIKQELRTMIGARNQQAQQQQQVHQQHQPQQQQAQAQQQPSVSQQSQSQQQPNQHMHQSSSMTPSSSQSTSSNMLCVSSSSNSLTAADLESFGFAFDFSEPGIVSSGTSVNSNCGPGSPLFSNMFDNGSQVSSPLTSSSSTAQGSMTFSSSDNNGSDQKRSLLQELLSSPSMPP